MFLITFTQNCLFLKLMYRAFNQKGFQQKLVRLPLQCHLERDLKLILHDVYKNNIELQSIDYKITRWEFLRAIVDSIGIIILLICQLSQKKKDGYVINHH